nr:anti-sigma factor [Microbacterium endophyticum]
MSPEDQTAFADAMLEHPEWADLVSDDLNTAAALADTIPAVAPPRALREGILAQINSVTPLAVTESEDAVSRSRPARGRWGSRAWFALAASLALVLGIGGGAVYVSQQLSTPASVVALDRIEQAADAQSATTTLADGGEATLHWSASEGEAVLVSDGLPTLTEAQAFELWYVRDGEAIAAGVFDASNGEATAVLSGEMHEGDVIAVTVEAAGGSADGQPTSTPIIAIETGA